MVLGPLARVGSGASRVAASSGGRSGGTCQSLGPWGQSLQRSGPRGRLFLSTSYSSSPGGAPPRGTGRVRPLRSPAEATVTPPPAQNPHLPTHLPLPRGKSGEGEEAEEGREAEPRRGAPHPVLAPRWGPAPSPDHRDAGGPRGLEKRHLAFPPRPGPCRSVRARKTRLLPQSQASGASARGRGLRGPVAVGGGPGLAGRFRFRPRGRGGAGLVGEFGGDEACVVTLENSVSGLARCAGLRGRRDPPAPRRGGPGRGVQGRDRAEGSQGGGGWSHLQGWGATSKSLWRSRRGGAWEGVPGRGPL